MIDFLTAPIIKVPKTVQFKRTYLVLQLIQSNIYRIEVSFSTQS